MKFNEWFESNYKTGDDENSHFDKTSLISDAIILRMKKNLKDINEILDKFNVEVLIDVEDKHGENRFTAVMYGKDKIFDYSDTYFYREFIDEADARIEAIQEFLVCLNPFVYKSEEELTKAKLIIQTSKTIQDKEKRRM